MIYLIIGAVLAAISFSYLNSAFDWCINKLVKRRLKRSKS